MNESLSIWILFFLCLIVDALSMDAGEKAHPGAMLAAWWISLVAAAWGARRVVRLYRKWGHGNRQVVVVAQSGRPISKRMALAIAGAGRSISKTISLPEVSGEGGLVEDLRELIDHLRRYTVDEILLAIDWSDEALIERITQYLRIVPVPIGLIPERGVNSPLKRPLLDFGKVRVIELRRPPLTRRQLAVKRSLDLAAAMLALLITLPALLVIVAWIRVDSSGPALFRQRRIGFNGRLFYIYKFRTMTTLEDGAVIRQACRGDSRITRVGRVLRKFSLDELPQLLNVLRGDMSLVGPRPHALAHDTEYSQAIAGYGARHNVKPGITGWAQVNGWRGPTPQLDLMVRRVEHDLWYVDNWSLWLDIKIMLLTIAGAANTPNAL